MKTWTRQAEERFSEYLEARIRQQGLVGEDAQEFRDDMRMHVHEEAERESSERIGTVELEKVLKGLDSGGTAEPATPQKVKKGKAWLMIFGVIAPLAVAIFEILTGFCGGVFFDPVPTPWHGLLVLAVPLLNWWLLSAGQRAGSRLQGLAAGVVVAVGTFYALLFLPLSPLSMMALVAFGMGLLSLTPIFAGIACWLVSRRSRNSVAQPWRFRQGWRGGLAASVLVLLILEGPGMWTRWQLGKALSEDPREAAVGVERLRAFHSERSLLRACYEGNRGTTMATDIAGWMEKGWRIPMSMLGFNSWQVLDSGGVRDVFFRATGKPFNSVKPPRMAMEKNLVRGRGNAMEGFEFDDHLGGDSVAIRLKDLDLSESRFDGHVDGLSRIGYGEWTMVFRNRSSQVKEARCQVRLPRGGRVSRLTLWVNGEPREAAFSSVEKVKAAYREIAVVQRRDPVLVTMAGPDTVMVQCFPVPANGEMKIRFGVTAPLDGSRWELPRIVERNFGVEAGAEHSLWLQGDQAFEVSGGGGLAGSMKDGEGFSTNAVLSFEKALGEAMAIRLGELDGAPKVVWCEDEFAEPDGRYLERVVRTGVRPPVDKLLLVVDGSSSMADQGWRIGRVLERLGSEHAVKVIMADDGAKEIAASELSGFRFSGGRDNEPALRLAVSEAKQAEHGAVVWLHGPQAVQLTKSEGLLQLLERGTRRPKIHDIEMVAGPNRLVESLGKAGVLERGPSLLDGSDELLEFLVSLLEGEERMSVEWKRHGSLDELEGEQVWNHLARLWAIEQSESEAKNRARIAAKYQLVTPVSGAVVLETMEQFEEHGLTPIDADAAPSIPGVPEPSSSLLLLIGLSAGVMRRRRKS